MKKIIAVTGIRSEYDLMVPVFQRIENHPDLSLSLIVTGAHLSPGYGMTIDGIKEDGFAIADVVESLINSNGDSARIKGAAVQLYGLAQSIERLRPDMLIAFGDREESITTALVGAYLNILVVHISGGDRVVGNVDDQVRHAVTKLSHLHFTTNEGSKERILRMGEQPFRVFCAGHPGLDRLAQVEHMSRQDLIAWHGFDEESTNKPLLLLIQHSLSSEIEHAYEQMKATMQAVEKLELPTVISYPNSDAGSQDIIKCINEYEHLPFVKAHRNIPRYEFVNTMRHASCMLGNSSSGLMEAPFLKLPVINVGNRQKERLHAENIIFVAHDVDEIVEMVKKTCFDETFIAQVKSCKSPYGDGKAAEKIVDILTSVEPNDKWLIKDITY